MLGGRTAVELHGRLTVADAPETELLIKAMRVVSAQRPGADRRQLGVAQQRPNDRLADTPAPTAGPDDHVGDARENGSVAGYAAESDLPPINQGDRADGVLERPPVDLVGTLFAPITRPDEFRGARKVEMREIVADLHTVADPAHPRSLKRLVMG